MHRIFIFFLALSFSVNAQIYKWVDEEGNVHFGDEASRRSAQQDHAQDVSDEMSSINLSEGSETGYTPSALETETRKAQQKKQTDTQKKQMVSACAQARKDLQILSGPVYFTDDKGEAYTVSEREREEMEQNLKADIQKYCT